jgi:hypothetical protein
VNLLVRKLNSLIYRYRDNRWRWDPRFRDDPSLPIDRPIFLLGTQGGGLTLTARILARHPEVVSVTGDHLHWAAYHEMQNTLERALTPSFTWLLDDPPGYSFDLAQGYGIGLHTWMYASDGFWPLYHRDAQHATPAEREGLRSLLRKTIRLNRSSATQGPGRFLDKSQTFTVKIGLLEEILGDCNPRYVLLTRDPFAMCWRAVHKVVTVMALRCSEQEKFEIALQHWKNSMQEALAWEGRAALAWWRFEDLLAEPDRVIHEICDHAELPFRPEILPGPEDRIPWGSAHDAFDRSKWYPVRPNVSARYLKEVPEWAIERVKRECSELLERFDYHPPERVT